MKKTKILFVSPEIAPFAKTGNVGDVVKSMALAASKENCVSAVMPLYSLVNISKHSLKKTDISFMIPVSDKEELAEVWVSSFENSEIPVYFIQSRYFERDALYGNDFGDYPDNSERFVFFSRAVLELSVHIGDPDIIHCHEWHTALLPVYLKEIYQPKNLLTKTKTVLTIHNPAQQGKFWMYDLHILNLGWEMFTPDKLEFYNHINYLKGGVVYADKVTTVSPRFADEIKTSEFGQQLEGIFKKYSSKLSGIINGIEPDFWNPEKDSLLSFKYCADKPSNKSKNKTQLLATFGIDTELKVPVFSIISRFLQNKGFDIIPSAIEQILQKNEAIFIFMGSGDKFYEAAMKNLQEKFPGKVVIKSGLNEDFAHLVYAGSDFYLMPSKYEPCGINQMIAMRYGAIPVARNVGGLSTTISDVSTNPETGRGILFDEYSALDLANAIEAGIKMWNKNKKQMKQTILNCMSYDFSWSKPAAEYQKIYDKLTS